MCVVCLLPHIEGCVSVWDMAAVERQPDRSLQSSLLLLLPPGSQLLLLPRDGPCSSLTSARSAREGSRGSRRLCQPACQHPACLLGPSRTTCGLHSPPPGPAGANPSASELSSPAAAPLSSVAHTHCLIRTLGLPKFV
jgi:hypothetical protein